MVTTPWEVMWGGGPDIRGVGVTPRCAAAGVLVQPRESHHRRRLGRFERLPYVGPRPSRYRPCL